MQAVPSEHPITRASAAIDAALKSVTDANPVFMTTEDKTRSLHELARLESRLAELRLRVMATSEDVADGAAARDIGAWFAFQTRTDLTTARAEARLAYALDRHHPCVARGLREGEVTLPQARVIVRALEALPDDVPAETVAEAEVFLCTKATEFGPRELARLGNRVLDVVAPEIAEAAEARRLADLERHASERTRLTMRRLGDGTTRISGRLSDATASRLATYLEAFANPRIATRQTDETDTTDGSPDPLARLPYPRRLGEAFTQLLEAMDPSRLPVHGGDATTVVVTIGLDQLRSELAVGDLIASHVPSEGAEELADRLSASEVRRLACNAHIVPAVLGGRSEVLDLGRRQRLFTAAQRRALVLRDRMCRAEGCDIPGTWTEAHHWLPWSTGGPTDLDNAVLLCSHHHHRVHEPDRHAERLPNGDVRFHRRR